MRKMLLSSAGRENLQVAEIKFTIRLNEIYKLVPFHSDNVRNEGPKW